MTNAPRTAPVLEGESAKGAAVYTKSALSLYDLFVVGFSNSFAWKCPSRLIVDFYNQHVSGKHLDVGVGTGYFLDKCRLPSPAPEIALLDLNPNSLHATAKRLRRYNPSCHEADVLRPIDIGHSGFGSIGLNYLLHCLPGDLASKRAVFGNLKPLLKQGGVIFGTTILGEGVAHNALAGALMKFYNARGIFGNSADRLRDLEAGLREHFSECSVRLQGCVAFFSARGR